MELTKAIDLIKPAARLFNKKNSWADLGCGAGLFTTALAKLLYEGSTVNAVDKDESALAKLKLPQIFICKNSSRISVTMNCLFAD